MTALGAPLVVYSAIAICDNRHDHEARLITDGHRAYAYGIEPGATDAAPVARWDTGAYEATCRQPTPHDGDPCDGALTWEPTEGDWNADAESLDLLARYGQPVQR